MKEAIIKLTEKRLSNLLAALVFASLVIFMSCGGGGSDPGPSELEITVNNLTVSGGFSNPATVQTDGGTPDGVWDTFGISFSGDVNGGNYTLAMFLTGLVMYGQMEHGLSTMPEIRLLKYKVV